MKARALIVIICLMTLLVCSGCEDILKGDTYSIVPHHIEISDRPPEEVIEVSDYAGLKAAVLGLVTQHVDTGRLRIYSYSGDIQTDIDKVCLEIQNDDPLGAYAVSGLICSTQRIVSYTEVEIKLEYKRDKSQIDSIITVSTQRFLATELLSAISDYRDEAVFRTSIQTITAEEITDLVRQVYYQNPRRIVMLPVTAVDTFPSSGDDRIYELVFRNYDRSSIMQQYGGSLTESVRRNAESAGGDTDAEILLSLAENLIGACAYDEGIARTISEHGAQNFAVTAYGALVTGSAVGEGFAMAFKALCDELGFNCSVVLGSLDGMVHAWNIVSIYGDYYHIDVSMCTVNGIETMFLKTDEDIKETYLWDSDNTVKCNGELTYEIVAKIDETIDGDQTEGLDEDMDGENDTTGTGDENAAEDTDNTDNTDDIRNPD